MMATTFSSDDEETYKKTFEGNETFDNQMVFS